MAREEVRTFKIEDAQIMFRNFAGKEGEYNAAGKRNFALVLDPAEAKQLLALGWNCKQLQPREEGDVPTDYITVAVSFDNYPPRIVMMAGEVKTPLNENTVEVLDWANIKSVDLICRAYDWSIGSGSNAKSGTKAYVKTMVVKIDEDDLERKYEINSGGE